MDDMPFAKLMKGSHWTGRWCNPFQYKKCVTSYAHIRRKLRLISVKLLFKLSFLGYAEIIFLPFSITKCVAILLLATLWTDHFVYTSLLQPYAWSYLNFNWSAKKILICCMYTVHVQSTTFCTFKNSSRAHEILRVVCVYCCECVNLTCHLKCKSKILNVCYRYK